MRDTKSKNGWNELLESELALTVEFVVDPVLPVPISPVELVEEKERKRHVMSTPPGLQPFVNFVD